MDKKEQNKKEDMQEEQPENAISPADVLYFENILENTEDAITDVKNENKRYSKIESFELQPIEDVPQLSPFEKGSVLSDFVSLPEVMPTSPMLGAIPFTGPLIKPLPYYSDIIQNRLSVIRDSLKHSLFNVESEMISEDEPTSIITEINFPNPPSPSVSYFANFSNPTPADNDHFGAVSYAKDNYLMVSVSQDDNNGYSNTGIIYVYNMYTGAVDATINNPTPATGDYFGGNYLVDGDTLVIGQLKEPNGGNTNAGVIYFYDTNTWTLNSTAVNPNPASYDQMGQYMEIHNGVLIVYMPFDDNGGESNAGAVYLFDVASGGMIAEILNPSPDSNESFGSQYQSQIVDNTLILGVGKDDNNSFTDSGSIYLYDIQTGTNLLTIENPSPENGGQFGSSFDLYGNIIAVSEMCDTNGGHSNSGAVYLFNATTGDLITTITNPSPETDEYFGRNINEQNGVLIVSTSWAEVGGQARVGEIYLYDSATGVLLSTITNPTPGINENFGLYTQIYNNTLAVFHDSEDVDAFSDAGVIYLYNIITGNLITTLQSPTLSSGEYFGDYYHIEDNLLVVNSVYAENGGHSHSGAVYVYDLNDGSLVSAIENPSPQTSENFGWDSQIYNDTLIIASPYDDNGGQMGAGAIYLYNINTGQEIAKVENPDPDVNDQFGRYYLTVGDTLIASAFYDDNGGYTNSGELYSFLYDFNGDGRVDGTVGDDVLYGSEDINLLVGNGGADRFVFQDTTAFDAVDIIEDFTVADGDTIDIRDVLDAYDPMMDDVYDFVRLTSSGDDAVLEIDIDGTAMGYSYQAIATISGGSGLVLTDLINDGDLVIPV